MQKENGKFAVLLNGDATPSHWLKKLLEGRRIIAADGGIRHARTFALRPELWVGDADSVDARHLAEFTNLNLEQHPSEKAISDGELAIERAFERGCRDLLLVGALGGGRSDHIMFHASMACRFAEETGAEIKLAGADECAVTLVGRQTRAPLTTQNQTFSIVGLSELSGVSITHAKWPLSDVDVALGSTLTLSNIGSPDTKITLDNGRALVMMQMTEK